MTRVMSQQTKYDRDLIKNLSNGFRTSQEIAEIVGCPMKYVQKQWIKFDWPRPKHGPPVGERNPCFRGGRIIDRDGYAWLSVPPGVPRAFYRKNREFGRVREHHLVAMEKLGRPLLPAEVVDHIDGMKLHNVPENVQVFPSNAAHLKATISGQVPDWSEAGLKNLRSLQRDQQGRLLPGVPQRIDNYRQNKEQGGERLLQILLVRELLGKDSPFLLGTARYLRTIGIDAHDNSGTPEGLRCLLRACNLHESKFLKIP